MIVTDLVYQQIREHLARHQPERGGALYGPKDYPIVTHFEYDFDARTTEVSYVPSPRLIANAPRVEKASGLRFKGIVHSHPRGMIQTSWPLIRLWMVPGGRYVATSARSCS